MDINPYNVRIYVTCRLVVFMKGLLYKLFNESPIEYPIHLSYIIYHSALLQIPILNVPKSKPTGKYDIFK